MKKKKYKNENKILNMLNIYPKKKFEELKINDLDKIILNKYDRQLEIISKLRISLIPQITKTIKDYLYKGNDNIKDAKMTLADATMSLYLILFLLDTYFSPYLINDEYTFEGDTPDTAKELFWIKIKRDILNMSKEFKNAWIDIDKKTKKCRILAIDNENNIFEIV